jgi:peptidoglycan/xylan/chitin deacetylase (PgdA/CDA1 family)
MRHGLVLLYHRIAEPGVDPWRLRVTPEHFDAHLRVLLQYADIVPLAELPQRLTAPPARRVPVAITFDDGYADNAEAALQLLQRHGIPATVFVSTGWIGRQGAFWWDRLAAAVFEARPLPDAIEVQTNGEPLVWRKTKNLDVRERKRLHAALWRRCRILDEAEREPFLDRVIEALGGDGVLDHLARPMTISEIGRLTRSGLVDLGAHSVSHRPLPALPAALRFAEISRSREHCEYWTGTLPHAFAYPYGEVDADSVSDVARAGFRLACSTEEDLVWEKPDLFTLPRFTVLDWDAARFSRELGRVWLP